MKSTIINWGEILTLNSNKNPTLNLDVFEGVSSNITDRSIPNFSSKSVFYLIYVNDTFQVRNLLYIL